MEIDPVPLGAYRMEWSVVSIDKGTVPHWATLHLTPFDAMSFAIDRINRQCFGSVKLPDELIIPTHPLDTPLDRVEICDYVHRQLLERNWIQEPMKVAA